MPISPCRETGKRKPCMRQKVYPHQTLNLPVPWSWNLNLELWEVNLLKSHHCILFSSLNKLWEFYKDQAQLWAHFYLIMQQHILSGFKQYPLIISESEESRVWAEPLASHQRFRVATHPEVFTNLVISELVNLLHIVACWRTSSNFIVFQWSVEQTDIWAFCLMGMLTWALSL